MDISDDGHVMGLLETALVIGLLAALLVRWPRIPLFGRFPGNVVIKGRKFRLYLPLGLCLVASLIITWLFNLQLAR